MQKRSQPIRTVRAVYGNGIFRPLGHVDLREGAVVEFEPRLVPGQRSTGFQPVSEPAQSRGCEEARETSEAEGTGKMPMLQTNTGRMPMLRRTEKRFMRPMPPRTRSGAGP